MSPSGQNRKSAETARMSVAEGGADVIRQKADISPRMSEVGGRTEVDFRRLGVRC
jgi:hypothetical protein